MDRMTMKFTTQGWQRLLSSTLCCIPTHRLYGGQLELCDCSIQFFLGKLTVVVDITKEVCPGLLRVLLQPLINTRLDCSGGEKKRGLQLKIVMRTRMKRIQGQDPCSI